MILVTGATGNIGSELVRALAQSNEKVRALVRRPHPGQLPANVETVIGDLNDPSSFVDALSGVTGVFLLSGYDNMEATLAEIRRAGVQRVVLLSSSAAPSGNLENAVAAYHIRSEQMVRNSGISYTFLQPNSFMSNTLQWAQQVRTEGAVRAPFADVAIATIDPFDIAAVAALALTTDNHAGRSYRLSGPEALRPADRLAALSKALGKDLQFEAQSNADADKEMRASMPGEYVDAFFDFFVAGNLDETTVLPTVHDILGRTPRTFEQWTQTHIDAFR